MVIQATAPPRASFRRARGFRGGFTAAEILISSTIVVMILGLFASFQSLSGRMYFGMVASSSTQQQLQTTLHTMTRDIRAARSLDASSDLSGTPPILVLQMPAYDSQRNLVIPISNGHSVTYTVSSDRRRLTRAESGVGTTNVISLDPNGSLALTVGYTATDMDSSGAIDANEYVTLMPSLTVTNKINSGTSVYDSSCQLRDEVLLRNR